MSDVVHVTHDESDMVVIEPQRPPTVLEPKWAADPWAPNDPAERARRRSEARRQQEELEKKTVQEEEERQRVLKLKKQAIMEQEREDEFLRKVHLDKELREATNERVRRERAIKEEEEMKAWETAEKKRIDRERKVEEARKLEEWRVEKQRRSQEIARRKEEEIQRKERERKARVKVVEAKIRKSSTTELMAGWVTVQTSDALTLMWKRRYFKFVGTEMSLYRSPKVGTPNFMCVHLLTTLKDMSQPVDTVELRGRVSALREWHEAYEELEAIDHSFALEFTDGQGPWSMFCDSEDDKVRAFIISDRYPHRRPLLGC
jgi:MAP7 domain-containing protein 1